MSYTAQEKENKTRGYTQRIKVAFSGFFKFPILGLVMSAVEPDDISSNFFFPPVSNFTVTLVILYTDLRTLLGLLRYNL
jgi:hypothetical protein